MGTCGSRRGSGSPCGVSTIGCPINSTQGRGHIEQRYPLRDADSSEEKGSDRLNQTFKGPVWEGDFSRFAQEGGKTITTGR